MQTLRRVLLPLLVAVGLLGWLGTRPPLPVAATTGPTYFLPPARYHVASKLALLYRGQYILRTAARAARLSGGAMGIEISGRGDLYGVGQFYGYDAQGYQTTWVATLYNFHPTTHGLMIIDLVGPAGHPLLGRLLMSRTKQGDLIGRIELGRRSCAVAWHKISSQ